MLGLMQRKVSFGVGEYYHLYNRGVEQRVIFMDDDDHKRFIALLSACNSHESINLSEHFQGGGTYHDLFQKSKSPLVAIGTYCLMPNHFHILVREIEEKGISTFMLKLTTAYSMYFNAKYSRKGRLFEGTFRSEHAADDPYLKYLFAYIHLNPIKLVESEWKKHRIKDRDKAKKFVSSFLYSSYQDYAGNDRIEKSILSKNEFPDYFLNKNDFNDYINDWIYFSDIAK